MVVLKQVRGMLAVLTLITLSVLTTGCGNAGSIMVKAEPVADLGDDQVLVTFIRPSIIGGAISFGLFDSDKTIGVLSPGKRIDYLTTPGEHTFLARAENWSCVKANLEANKHYVIKTNVVMGVWKARVALDPFRKAEYDDPGTLKDVRKWLDDAKPVMPDAEKVEAYTEHRKDQLNKAKAMFETEGKKFETLSPEDYFPKQ